MMKHFTIFLILFSFMSFVTATPTIEQWQTDNGARVYFVQATELPMIDIKIVFDAGSARDPQNKNGLAMLTNSLLNEGAGGLSADKIAEQFDNVGAQFSNSIDKDTANIGLRSLTDAKLLEPALTLFTTVLTQPDFQPTDFERVRQQMLVALKYEDQSPESIAENTFYQTLYGTHPYAIDAQGTKEAVAALKVEEVKAFYQRHYVAKNAVIAIVGAIDKARATTLANQLTQSLPAGEIAPPLPQPTELTEAKTIQRVYPATQTTVYLGQLGVARKDPDYFSLYVGNHILGGSGLVSRLSEQIREQRGLVYSTNSYFYPYRVTGAFVLQLQTRNDQTNTALQVAIETVKNFVATGPTEAELTAAKQNIIGGFPLRIDSNKEKLSYVATIGFYHLHLDYLEKFPAQIEAVTVESIKAAFNRKIQLDKLLTVTVGGDKTAQEE
jgi:zinc protease